jgi:hypothetical protein
MKPTRFNQCLLRRTDPNGIVFLTTSWLPEPSAIKGRQLPVRYGERWISGWTVLTVGPPVDELPPRRTPPGAFS